jgi:hypothetical protein
MAGGVESLAFARDHPTQQSRPRGLSIRAGVGSASC